MMNRRKGNGTYCVTLSNLILDIFNLPRHLKFKVMNISLTEISNEVFDIRGRRGSLFLPECHKCSDHKTIET